MSARRSPARPDASPLFVTIFCVILTMYGGGFATIPAYLADLFGTQHVGAIHGRLLTAWSVAGIVGPVVVNYIREFQLARGVPPDQAYNITMYVLAAMLLGGLDLQCLLIRPVRRAPSHDRRAARRRARHGARAGGGTVICCHAGGGRSKSAPDVAAWTAIAIPLAWGVWITVSKSLALFQIAAHAGTNRHGLCIRRARSPPPAAEARHSSPRSRH